MVVCLHRVVDMGMQPRFRQRLGHRPVAGAQGGGGDHPGWRTEGVGNRVERHPVHQQTVHGMHGQVGVGGDEVGDRRGGLIGVRCGMCGHVVEDNAFLTGLKSPNRLQVPNPAPRLDDACICR